MICDLENDFNGRMQYPDNRHRQITTCLIRTRYDRNRLSTRYQVSEI